MENEFPSYLLEPLMIASLVPMILMDNVKTGVFWIADDVLFNADRVLMCHRKVSVRLDRYLYLEIDRKPTWRKLV